MPAALIPVAISAAAAAAGVGMGIVTVSAAVLTVATTALAAGVSYVLAPGQSNLNRALTPTAPGTDMGRVAGAPINAARTTTVRQGLPPRRFVYGKCRVGGAVLDQGPDEEFGEYYLITSALSDGVIQAVDGYYIGNELVPVNGSLEAASPSRYAGHVKFEVGLGATTQTTSALLTAHRATIATANFRQRGIARAVARLYWGADADSHNYVFGDGIEPTYLIRGVKVYDPREVSHDVNVPTTWAYSDNPALCTAHAITNAWKSAIPNTVIDWTSVSTAANDCDLAGFKMAGIVQSDIALADQVADMLRSFGGSLTFEDGKYSIRVDKARSSVWTATDQDILALGEMNFEADDSIRFDVAKGIYYDAAGDGSRVASPRQVLGGGARETTIDFPFVSDGDTAQILSFKKLTYDRDGRTISITMRDAALSLQPTEVFTISSLAFPFANGTWQVIQIDVAPVGCVISARRYLSAAYVDPSTYLI